MFKALRKQITPATVLAFVALVFAVTGGAFAATGGSGGGSGARASASVAPAATVAKAKAKVKTKAGPRGPAGPAGKAGTTGPAGPAGAQGAAGAQGLAGAKGEAGGLGPQGPAGPKGETGATGAEGKTGYAETLPSGKSVSGMWSDTGFGKEDGKDEEVVSSVSFPFRIENEQGEGPVAHFIKAPTLTEAFKGEFPTPPQGCTGNFEHPGAANGNLCVFASFPEENVGQETGRLGEPIPGICNWRKLSEPCNITTADPSGFGIVAYPEGEEVIRLQGSWVATAE